MKPPSSSFPSHIPHRLCRICAFTILKQSPKSNCISPAWSFAFSFSCIFLSQQIVVAYIIAECNSTTRAYVCFGRSPRSFGKAKTTSRTEISTFWVPLYQPSSCHKISVPSSQILRTSGHSIKACWLVSFSPQFQHLLVPYLRLVVMPHSG